MSKGLGVMQRTILQRLLDHKEERDDGWVTLYRLTWSDEEFEAAIQAEGDEPMMRDQQGRLYGLLPGDKPDYWHRDNERAVMESARRALRSLTALGLTEEAYGPEGGGGPRLLWGRLTEAGRKLIDEAS